MLPAPPPTPTPAPAAPALTTPGPTVAANLGYSDLSKGEALVWNAITVTISRAGVPVLTAQPLPSGARVSFMTKPRLHAVDLDGDHEPEVLVDVQTAGADCCGRTTVYRYTAGTYRPTVLDWSRAGYALRDVTGTKAPELVAHDDRFPELFGSRAHGPLQVLAWHDGRAVDVAAEAGGRLAGDAAAQLRGVRRARAAGHDLRAPLASALVDLVRLGRAPKAIALVTDAADRDELKGTSARAFLTRVASKMDALGYSQSRRLKIP